MMSALAKPLGLAAVALVSAVALGNCAGRHGGEMEDDEAVVPSESHTSSTGSCGVERWSIKTGTDSAASQVNFAPQATTIGSLDAIPVPSGFSSSSPRLSPSEFTTFKLTNVTLTQYKLESDSDYHLILTDGSSTMIAEIPDPACVGAGSPFATGINASRAGFDARYNVTTSFQTANVTVTVTGVGFFDVLHGQTGVAPNGIELHAVQSICFGANCGGGATPDFSLAAAPGALTSTGGAAAASTITATPANGFSGSIALAASGVPAGASAVFSATPISGSGSSTLTLTPGTAAAGAYAVTVTGTSGSLSHTAALSWTIAAAGGGALTNGTFETGSLSGWTAAGSASISTTAHAGTYSALVGSTAASTDSSIAQTFTAPAGSTALSFWYRVVCPDTVTYDWATATLKDNTSGTTSTVLPKTCTSSGAWVQATAALTAGHSYTLTLANHDDNYAGDPTYTLYDDVALTGSSPPPPPVVQITAPISGATVSGAITVTATATAAGGLSKIELYADGALLGSGTVSPASASWNTASVANGTHSLTARAYDNAGQVSTSAAVAVTVSNTTTTTELISNGGFEGSLSGWTLGGVKVPIDSTAHPHTGSASLRAGATTASGSTEPSGDSWAYQSVTIPAATTKATLTFWYYAYTTDTISYDWQDAQVRSSSGSTLVNVFHLADNSQVWTQKTVDLTAYKGQTVQIWFNCHGDGSTDPTTLWVDDVSVKVQ